MAFFISMPMTWPGPAGWSKTTGVHSLGERLYQDNCAGLSRHRPQGRAAGFPSLVDSNLTEAR